jgi:S-layer protein
VQADVAPTGSTVTNIEVAELISGGAIAANTSIGALTGITTLNSASTGGATLTAAATTAVIATNAGAAVGNEAIAVDGGSTVNVTSTNNIADTITVGGTTAAAGAVTVTSTGSTTNGDTQGNILVTGGTSVTVNQNAGNAAATGVDTVGGTVGVTGNASTTAVTVNQSATEVGLTATSDVAGKVGYAAGAVTIADVNAGSGTAAGTITNVTLNNYGNSTIDSSALTGVTLSGTGGTLDISRGALTATPTANDLALNVSGLTAGVIQDLEAVADEGFKTINVASTGTKSTIADLQAADATAINVSGDAAVTFTVNTVIGAVTDIVVTNTAGASFGTELATGVAFTGGAGADSVLVGATTKAIAMGLGDDTVTVSAAPGAGGSVAGGQGTDILVANTSGSAFIADPSVTGFETLRVAGGAAQGAHNANGFTALEVGALSAAASFTSVAAGVGLTQLDTMGQNLTVTLANATGLTDTFALNLKSAAAIGNASETITLAGVETVNITSTDTDATAHVNTVELVASSATAVTVAGNAGLIYLAADASIKSFDASGVILGAVTDTGVTFDSQNVTVAEAVTIKGSNGVDTLTGSATANDTISGGAGVDTLVYVGGSDSFDGGAGNDIFDVNATGTKTAFLKITDQAVGDTIDLVGISGGSIVDAALGAKVTLGGAATFDQYLDAAAAGNGANGLVTWFQFENNTYLVSDNDANAPFLAGTDAVVELSGVVDLSTSATVSDVLTIA